MTSSQSSVMMTPEQSDVYVSVECYNRVSLRSEVRSLSHRLLASPPEVLDAVVRSSVQSVAWQQARHSTQADSDTLAFTFAGFGNDDSVSGYEFMYSNAGEDTDWISVGQLVNTELTLFS